MGLITAVCFIIILKEVIKEAFCTWLMQLNYLEDWALLDRDHSNSLQGATEALRASTLRLPVVGKTVVCTFSFCLDFCR
jgi:hypothetical protein